MKTYKTLLFDLDGTLLDFEASEKYALHDVFKKHKCVLTETIVKEYKRINHRLWKSYEDGEMSRDEVIYTRFVKLFAIFDIPLDGISFEDEYQDALGRSHEAMPFALELVKSLYKDYSLYIVTNGVVATQYRRLKESTLDQYVKGVFVSEEIGYQKPKREYFDYCFARINHLCLEETLLIGDSLSSDMQGGVNAGIDTCWMNPKGLVKDKRIPITYEISQLQELYKILGKDAQG